MARGIQVKHKSTGRRGLVYSHEKTIEGGKFIVHQVDENNKLTGNQFISHPNNLTLIGYHD